jgi:hypothetical protein
MTRRSRITGFGSAAVLVLLGGVAAAAFNGTLGQVIAFVLIALGFVLATALAFYEVGLSEDRDRAREDATRTATRPGRVRPRLARMRGERRKLK